MFCNQERTTRYGVYRPTCKNNATPQIFIVFRMFSNGLFSLPQSTVCRHLPAHSFLSPTREQTLKPLMEMRVVTPTTTSAQCMSSVQSAFRGLNCTPSQQIMNFEEYNFELISILLYKADNSQITSSSPHLPVLRAQTEYRPLNFVLIVVIMNQKVHYKDNNFTSVYTYGAFYNVLCEYKHL